MKINGKVAIITGMNLFIKERHQDLEKLCQFDWLTMGKYYLIVPRLFWAMSQMKQD